MSALDELFSKCSAFNYCHETRDEYATHADAVMLAIGPARAELAALRHKLAVAESQAELGCATIAEYEAEIGKPPDGSHPDEQKPRAVTWHQERLNWVAELAALRAEVADFRNAAKVAASESCGDEKHCACVPLLRAAMNSGHADDCAGSDPNRGECGCGWLQRDGAHKAILDMQGEIARLRANLDANECNAGHKTLPLRLWDCPECSRLEGQELRAEIAAGASLVAKIGDRNRELEMEIESLRSDLLEARRITTTLDCRYTLGDVADISGSHCPLDKPCERCRNEREIARLEAKVEKADALAEAIDRHHGHNLDDDEIGCEVCEKWRAYRSAP